MSNVYAFIAKESQDILTIPIHYIINPRRNVTDSYMLERLLHEHPEIYYIGDLVQFQRDEFIS